MQTKDAKIEHSGEIKNMGVLDFTGMKSPEELSKITGIQNVGVILIPESLQHALTGIPITNVGSVVPIPDGAKVRVQTGQIQMSGDAFANGEEDVIMVIVGQLLITSKVTKITFRKLIVVGQVLAPKGSEAALGCGISLTGQVIYYTGDNPRIFIGNESLSKAFFELLERPICMLVIGEMRLESDVTAQLLKDKVSGIALLGKLIVPKELLPIVKVLTTDKFGKIEVN